MNNMVVQNGHNSPESAYIIQDYPYGRLRCQMRVWIETNNKGQRYVTQTSNPKRNQDWGNKPKASIYQHISLIVLNSTNGHVEHHGLSQFAWPEHVARFKADFYSQLDETTKARLDAYEATSRKLHPKEWAKIEAPEDVEIS